MAHLYSSIRINNAGIVHHPRDWRWDTTAFAWQDYDMWVALQGQGLFNTPEGDIPFTRGDCFVLRGRETYKGMSLPGTGITNLYIHFDFIGPGGDIIHPDEGQLPSLFRRIHNFDLMETMLRRVVQERDIGRHDAADAWLGAVLFELDRIDRLENLSGLEREQATAVEKICARISDNPGKQYRIEELAAMMYYTPDHFSRVFKKVTGVKPQEYVINRRIDRARNLLTTTGYSVSRVADMLGYNDVYFFSRQFKEKTGQSPRAYRAGESG